MESPTTQKALLYCRISSVKQRIEGSGLESQEHRCRQYAAAQGYDVEQVFKDDVTGGGDFLNRKGMVALLAYLKKNNATDYVVIFDDLKRFARDTMFHLKLRAELSLYNAQVECLNFRFEDTPEGKFVETIHAAQGQLEREQTGRQSIQKMQARLEQGYYVFHAPMGYRYEKTKEHGKLLVRDEPKASIIKEALEGFSSGRFQTQAEVTRFLDSFPEYPKGGNGKVHQQRVYNILTRIIYAGYVEHERWGIGVRKGQHEPLISIKTFQANQERLKGKALAPARKNINRDFPLRGFVHCDDCQRPLTACWAKGKTKHHPYYHCQFTGCVSYGKSIRRADLEGAFEELLGSLKPSAKSFAALQIKLEEAWDLRTGHQRKQVITLKENKLELDNEIDRMLTLAINASSPTIRNRYENHMNGLERNKLLIDEKITNCGRPIGDYDAKLRTAINFLENPSVLWGSDRLENKHAVLKLVFSENLSWKLKQGLRTPKTTLPINVLGSVEGSKSVMVRMGRLELPHLAILEPKSSASTNSATSAVFGRLIYLREGAYYT